MTRHSSFGSRLGAYRNRQIRLAIGRNNRNSKATVAPTDVDNLGCGTMFAIVAMIVLLTLTLSKCLG
jgi:hypothetical protein